MARPVWITPRNISPWSSQATAVVLACGLGDRVHRIERGRFIDIEFVDNVSGEPNLSFHDVIDDRMTENLTLDTPALATIFVDGDRKPLEIVDIYSDTRGPLVALQEYNKQMGLGLDQPNMEYLVAEYKNLGRRPNDIELFMWAQVNSLHCRRQVFNADWTIDGKRMPDSLFELIKNTHKTWEHTISAYSDNAAVLKGDLTNFWVPDYNTGSWKLNKEVLYPLIKDETHNHPAAISPLRQ